MSVEFLTDERAGYYGTFTQEPRRLELERFFFLDDADWRLIGKRRGDHSRLGFALQVCTVRYVSLCLQDPLAVPWSVVEYLAEQLGIGDPSCVKRYTEREKTAYEHAWEIQETFGYYAYDETASGAAGSARSSTAGRGRTPRGRWHCSTTRSRGGAGVGCCCRG